MKEAAMARVWLRDILSSQDGAAVMALRRGPGQDQYLNSMEEIFAEAGEEQRAMPHPWAVHDAATAALAGFAMISDNIPQPVDDDLVGPYYLWKLLIDHRFQRRGHGAATLDAVVDYLRTRPGAQLAAVLSGGRSWASCSPVRQLEECPTQCAAPIPSSSSSAAACRA
jgi:diamine N-acetyltransferase